MDESPIQFDMPSNPTASTVGEKAVKIEPLHAQEMASSYSRWSFSSGRPCEGSKTSMAL